MPSEISHPGVFVEELSNRVREIEGVATSVTAFAGWTDKGPSETAELVRSWNEFETKFGGLSATSLVSYSVFHFFENGGRDAYIVRITDSSTQSLLEPNNPDFELALLPDDQAGGLYTLDKIDLFNLLCVPGETRSPVITELQKFCRERRAFLIADCPGNARFSDLRNGPGDIADTDSSNSAFYFPWVLAPDKLQKDMLREFPPCGFVAGIYARTDSDHGVWRAPAGTSAQLKGCDGVASNKKMTDSENDTLNRQGINCIRQFRSEATVVWGARTLRGADAHASDWKYVPVRRTSLFIEESIRRGLQWVVFEPNDEPLWARIRLSVEGFLYGLFRQGAFQGVTPKDAYFVKCDVTTTTQNDIDQGFVNILIGFAPLKPAEFVIIRIQQMAMRDPTE